MSDGIEDLVFDYRDEPDTEPAGVTPGYLVLWEGGIGPAAMVRVGMLAEGDGSGYLVPIGEFEPVTIVDDTPAGTDDA